VNARGRRELRGGRGIIVQFGSVKGEYAIEFSDGRQPSLIYLEAARFDRVTDSLASRETSENSGA
jgi:hypothetical protein